MKILAIETSCDETAVAVVEDGHRVLANLVSSQVEAHKVFGGVVPEIASRKHLEIINHLLAEAVAQAEITFADVDAVAVTYGPGLVGALLVGVSVAKALALALGVPLIAVNHLMGHIYANFLAYPELKFPFVCLVVSGGHTDLVLARDHGDFEILGRTRDDAAGEAFDKVARLLGLGYPGGPAIDNLARQGNPEAIAFPRAFLGDGNLDFSFSGLKTAVMNCVRREGEKFSPADIAASFQKAVVDVLVEKAFEAVERAGVKTLLIAGGVAANSYLRQRLAAEAPEKGVEVKLLPLELCTDNAAMIGCAAYFKYSRQDFAPLSLNAVPDLVLGEERY